MLMNRVQLRNKTWYFRARIPAPLQYLAPVKYFFRSLYTGNRKEALAKSLSHSYILDLKIKLLRKLDMLIKSGKIVLDKDDINKIIKYKLDQLTDALSDNYDDIVDGTFDKDSKTCNKTSTTKTMLLNNLLTDCILDETTLHSRIEAPFRQTTFLHKLQEMERYCDGEFRRV